MANAAPRVVELQELTQTDTEIDHLASRVCSYSDALGIEVSHDVASVCVRHLLMVNQVNQWMNLTRITDLDDALLLHIVDSLALSLGLPFEPESFLDLGTGAGFPGIPLGSLTGASGILLDSVGKKVSAVRAFIRALNLDGLQAVHDRAESFAVDHHEQFDLVVARAVGQSGMLIEYATPCLEMDGYLMLAKANVSSDEMRVAQKTATICGLELVGQTQFDLPKDLGHRTLLLYQKVSDSRIALPRTVGLAKREPLAR